MDLQCLDMISGQYQFGGFLGGSSSTGGQLEAKLREDESSRKATEVTGLLKALNTQWVDYEGAAMAVQNSIPDCTSRIF